MSATAFDRWARGADLNARVTLEPSGRHMLTIIQSGAPVDMQFTIEQVKWLEQACREFLVECAFDDGRPTDRTNRAVKPLMQHMHVGRG